jgi:hypothetical protein
MISRFLLSYEMTNKNASTECMKKTRKSVRGTRYLNYRGYLGKRILSLTKT